eukprot:COSAG01_NODE_1573_length_9865_cov_132.568503_2_plen_164_part_00
MWRLFLSRNIETQRARVDRRRAGQPAAVLPPELGATLRPRASVEHALRQGRERVLPKVARPAARVSRGAFPSWSRSTLTEIHLLSRLFFSRKIEGGKRPGRTCTASGIFLIFDEVYTGFRLAPGGAQELFDVHADMVVYGKTLAGGNPIVRAPHLLLPAVHID